MIIFPTMGMVIDKSHMSIKRMCVRSKIAISLALVVLMVFTNVPVGFFEFAITKWNERNIVDLMWQAQHDVSVVDSFSPRTAQAAESAVDTAILDATDEYAPSPLTVLPLTRLGMCFC